MWCIPNAADEIQLPNGNFRDIIIGEYIFNQDNGRFIKFENFRLPEICGPKWSRMTVLMND